MSDRIIQIGLNDFMNHAELIAQLTVGSGLIKNPQGVLPKTTAHRQNRVILGEMGNVILPMTNGCTG